MPGGYPEDDHGYRRQVWRGDRHLVILPVGVKAVLLVVPAGPHLSLREPFLQDRRWDAASPTHGDRFRLSRVRHSSWSFNVYFGCHPGGVARINVACDCI